MQRIKSRFAEKFDDNIRFIKGVISTPKTVGAIMPTSARMANRMASIIDTGSGLPVLELGPGTGVITRAILDKGVKPENVVSVEYSSDFVRHLRGKYPGVNFINGDAFSLAETLENYRGQKFDCVISGIPLLNFPMHQRVKLIEDLLKLVPVGRPVVQFSYGPVSPVVARPDSYTIKHFDFIMRNIPPAQIWHYKKLH
ncbi:methyltransferase domain-containing protein [Rhizobium sp. TH2]|uniref:phospholipid N-methyltransferase PmtA n=1 Tax=Rhizobium sp. TH2 TaxID=2775403 RepID=UPI0021581D41|nr:class I SAM-dependent methyltransferase [Rhizobium sp. TH2]UVC08946.1 methyltransferase domain-containing protein [Rhizobium sp. TH2]